MPIYHYDGSQKSPPNYVGVRVAVMINSKLRQKWYNFRQSGGFLEEEEQERIRDEAETLEKEWMQEKQHYADIRRNEAKEDRKNSVYVTGVAGIKMRFVKQVKKRLSKSKKTKKPKTVTYVFYTPYLIVNSSHKSKRFIKQFNVITRGYDKAWNEAVQYFAQQKEITEYEHLLERQPSVKQWTKIRNWQNKKGYEIPESRMPKELLDQS